MVEQCGKGMSSALSTESRPGWGEGGKGEGGWGCVIVTWSGSNNVLSTSLSLRLVLVVTLLCCPSCYNHVIGPLQGREGNSNHTLLLQRGRWQGCGCGWAWGGGTSSWCGQTTWQGYVVIITCGCHPCRRYRAGLGEERGARVRVRAEQGYVIMMWSGSNNALSTLLLLLSHLVLVVMLSCCSSCHDHIIRLLQRGRWQGCGCGWAWGGETRTKWEWPRTSKNTSTQVLGDCTHAIPCISITLSLVQGG